MKFSKNYYKYIIGIAFAFFVLNVNAAREVCFTTPTTINTPVANCPPNEVCVTVRIVNITQCVTVPDGYTGSVIPAGSSPVSGSGSVPVRPEPILNPVDRPKPQMCYTIELDKSKCEEKAQTDFTTSAEVCPYYAAAAVAGGGAATAVWAVVAKSPTARQELKNYLAIAAGGAVATSAFGDLVYNSCRDGFNDVKDIAQASCQTDADKKKQECSIYN